MLLLGYLCPYSSVAEHFLGKEEAGGSIPLMGSSFLEVAIEL